MLLMESQSNSERSFAFPVSMLVIVPHTFLALLLGQTQLTPSLIVVSVIFRVPSSPNKVFRQVASLESIK